MTGELIPTGVTFGVGRNSINDAFSGTAYLNNISLDSGANFSAGTGGGIIYSAGTDLYGIFSTFTGEITASNGLTKSVNNITIGGSLTGDTLIETTSGDFLISGSSATFDSFKVETNYTSAIPAKLAVGRGTAQITSTSATTVASLFSSGGSATISCIVAGTYIQNIVLSPSGMVVTDGLNSRGLSYNANYHSNYNSRTLVDKEYVDNVSSSATTWTAGTGLESIIQINSDSPNLASGEVALAIGKGNQATGEVSFVGGYGNTATGVTSFAFGNSNNVYGEISSILGGQNNSINSLGPRSSIIGGYQNNISKGYNSNIIGGSANTLSQGAVNTPNNSAIIGGTNNFLHSENSVILGGNGLTGDSVNTVFMQIAYIDEYLDLNPQTTLPAASIGRMFFSGTPLNRMMYNTGGTDSDWIII